jgi:ABC-type proline/glycine betaine transport system permease subunit
MYGILASSSHFFMTRRIVPICMLMLRIPTFLYFVFALVCIGINHQKGGD